MSAKGKAERNTKKFTYLDDEGNEVEVELPTRMEVCDNCEGHGYVMNPSMRNHAYTEEEFNETFWDEEDREQYFTRGGIYDVQCPTCNGRNVVPVVDEARLTKEQKALFQKLQKRWEEDARERAEEARILRMESGGYE